MRGLRSALFSGVGGSSRLEPVLASSVWVRIWFRLRRVCRERREEHAREVDGASLVPAYGRGDLSNVVAKRHVGLIERAPDERVGLRRAALARDVERVAVGFVR